jgi:uncharacterized protein YegJ (DUF2314 family)
LSDPTVSVGNEDSEMNAAIAEARATLNQFLDAFENPGPNQRHFLLKARFEDETTVEHIWLADLDLSKAPATGTVANESGIQGIQFMQRVAFSSDQITDWMFEEDGHWHGGFTTRLLKLSDSQLN